MSSKQRKQNSRFLAHEDCVLKDLVFNSDPNLLEKEKWNQITTIFNSQFLNSKANVKRLKARYNNSLNSILKRDPLSKEEEKFVLEEVKKVGPKFRKIAKMMLRTENSVKNCYYERIKSNLSPQDLETIHNLNADKFKQLQKG
jgi:hypothetical protein